MYHAARSTARCCQSDSTNLRQHFGMSYYAWGMMPVLLPLPPRTAAPLLQSFYADWPASRPDGQLCLDVMVNMVNAVNAVNHRLASERLSAIHVHWLHLLLLDSSIVHVRFKCTLLSTVQLEILLRQQNFLYYPHHNHQQVLRLRAPRARQQRRLQTGLPPETTDGFHTPGQHTDDTARRVYIIVSAIVQHPSGIPALLN